MRGVRSSIAVMAAVLLGAVSVTPAAAQSLCTGSTFNIFCGTDAGAGASGSLGDSGFGAYALSSGDSGGDNTAVGYVALSSNTTGEYNTAIGEDALLDNTSGGNNVAVGEVALEENISGIRNTATGDGALVSNTTGTDNTATGSIALENNLSGDNNIAVGRKAGDNLTTGDNNIDIGNEGVAAEADTIRIGTQGTQTDTYIAGIFGTPKIKKACEVVVESTGLLGCVKSSARHKRDILDMGDASDRLMKLRPVTFTYKGDATGIQQYGLIAEEVEKVYPELVIDDASGRPETVEYQVLPAMLLNEVQKLAKENRRLVEQVAALKKRDARIDALVERMNALERQVRAF